MGNKILLLLALIVSGFYVSKFVSTFKVTDISQPENITVNQINPIDVKELTGRYEEDSRIAYFHEDEVPVPAKTNGAVLGTPEVKGRSEQKRIEIDLTNQKLYAFEGDKKIYDFLVSTGKWGRTPTGEFRIWTKLKYTLMSGGSKDIGTYYYLPNVPFTMFFANEEIPRWKGFGIHGTYWHDNFGTPMSHGCINMKTEEAEQLFYWANPSLKDGQWSVYSSDEDPGTRVIIYGEAPV